MDKENILILMAVYMKVHGKMTKDMDKENVYIVMAMLYEGAWKDGQRY